MKRTVIDLSKLVAITCQFLKNLGTNLNFDPKFSKNEQNIWVKICKEYYGKVCYKQALLIYMWFKRNTQNYSKIVHQKLNILEFNSNENPEKSKQQENETFIEFSLKEFKSFAVSNSKRRRLLGDFEEALNTQLQKNGFNCYFKCNHNWFKSENSRKKNLPIWSGLYKCIHEECQQSVITEIAEIENEKVVIKILYSDKKKHEKIIKSDRIIGLERKLTALKLKAEGVSNVCDTNNTSKYFLKSFLNKKTL